MVWLNKFVLTRGKNVYVLYICMPYTSTCIFSSYSKKLINKKLTIHVYLKRALKRKSKAVKIKNEHEEENVYKMNHVFTFSLQTSFAYN